MEEKEIIIDEKYEDLLKTLLNEGSIDESDNKGYKINYFGEKSQPYFEALINNYPIDENNLENVQSKLNKIEDTRNYILYIKYKDIYIGGLSIFDLESKEGLGLYKYLNNSEQAFYLGQWEQNQKSGIGFLKIDNNHLYFGNFKNNQMDGDGFYYNKKNKNYYFGLFNNGIFKKGLYCNLLKDIYYIGGFEENKKNDRFCCYFNSKKNRLFFGEIRNDLFIKGHIFFLSIKESEEEINIEIEKIIFYNRNNKDNSPLIIQKKTNETFESITYEIIQGVDVLKSFLEQIKLFEELEETYNDSSYNNGIGRYNNYENQYSFEKDIIENYNYYFENLNEYLNNINMGEINKQFNDN